MTFSFHLCFHFNFILLVFLHFGTLESKNEKNSRTFSFYFHFCFHVILILPVFLHFGTLESKNEKNTRGHFHFILICVFISLSFCWFSCISGPWKAKMKNTKGNVHFIFILLVVLHFGTLESKNEETRGNFHFIFICVFISLSSCWFSCISGPWKAKMKKNSRKCPFYFHLCFHVIFILLVFLHFGTLESKNEKTRGHFHFIFILLVLEITLDSTTCLRHMRHMKPQMKIKRKHK